MNIKTLLTIIAINSALFAFAGFSIVTPDNQRNYDKFTVNELSSHLQKITADKVEVFTESTYKGSTPVIYLGKTRQGIAESKKLTLPEQWRIKSVGNDKLVITGSDPKGVLYGVYEFLERYGNVRHFDEKNSSIPVNKNFKLPSTDISGRPYFRIRHIYDSLDWYRDTHIFKARNRGQAYGNAGTTDYPLLGSPSPHHTFHNYADTFPVKKTEMFSLRPNNERVKDSSGQLCMTNTDTRKYVLAALRSFIKKDRVKAAKDGVPPPFIYDISANDNNNQCVCPDCKAIADREGGTYSAPLLDFINYIAREIRKEYPEIYIRTFAYLFSYNPPKTMRAEDNVIMHIAMLGMEFGGNGKRDTMRPLTYKTNKEALDLIIAWSKYAKNIAVWDYWKLFGGDHANLAGPYVNLEAIYSAMPIYKKYNVKDIFVECESPESTSFFALKRYIGLRSMNIPELNVQQEINTFMQGMYAEAAPIMKEYLNFLTAEQEKANIILGPVPPNMREYYTAKYFKKAFALLNKAVEAVKNNKNPLIKANIEREFIPVYGALIRRYFRLHEDDRAAWNYEDLLKNYEKYLMPSIDYYYPLKGDRLNLNGVLKNTWRQRLTALKAAQKQVKIPEQFKGKNVIALPYYTFKTKSVKFIDDKDSIYGKAVALGKEFPNKTKNGTTGFGIWDTGRKRPLAAKNIKTTDVPQDEKYHIVRLGKVTFRNSTPYFWGTSTWIIQCALDNIYEPTATDKENTYDAYMSVKFSGPVYVKDSNSPDFIAIDAIYFVK